MVAGGFIAGAICTPDYARYLKNGTQVFWMTSSALSWASSA